MKITPWKFTSIVPSLSLLGGIALLPFSAHGQTPSIVTMNDKSNLTIKTSINKTYFLWQSENLTNWVPLNTYVVGDGTQKTVSIVPSEQSKMFYRFGIAPTNILNPDDTDGDGILNSYEISFRLDPNWINSVTDLASVEVDSRISGKTASNSLRIYNNYTTNGASLIFQRNPDSWINSITNKSCISPWNSNDSNRRAGTLITPRHVIFCAHFGFFVPANSQIHFVTDAGTVITRTILRTLQHPNYGIPFAYNHDIVIGVLDQDVPSSVQTAKFLPNNWNEYFLPNVKVPSLRLNQHEEALVGDIYTNTIANERAYHEIPLDPTRLSFYYSQVQANPLIGLYGGDSGNGGFMVINSQLVLTNVWTFGGPGSGTSVTNEKSFINSMISQVDSQVGSISGYNVQELSFSSFKKIADIPPQFLPIAFPNPPVIQESNYPLLEE